MRIRVLLFGPAAERLQTDAVVIDLPGAGPIPEHQVRRALASQHTEIASHVDAGRLAVNSRFTGPEHGIHEDDEVALITMVSGG